RLVALAQRVVFGVGDLRRILGVVAPVVMRDFGSEAGEFGLRLLFGQELDRTVGETDHVSHAPPPAIRLAAAARASAVTILPDSMRAISSCRVSGSSSSTRVTVARVPCCLSMRQ